MVLNTDGVLLWSEKVGAVSFDASTRYVLRAFATTTNAMSVWLGVLIFNDIFVVVLQVYGNPRRWLSSPRPRPATWLAAVCDGGSFSCR